MKIAVIGTSGQLGYDLARILPARGHDIRDIFRTEEIGRAHV